MNLCRQAPAPWWRPAFLAFALCACWLAFQATLFVHEVLGHGLSAWVLGARVYAFFMNPFGGALINSGIPGPAWRTDLGMAAGTLANLLAGWLAWITTDRFRSLPMRLFAAVLAGINLLGATLYVGVDSVVGAVAGPHGDISKLLARWNVPGLPVALLGMAASLWISVRLGLRILAVAESGGLRPQRRRDGVGLIIAMVLPWVTVTGVGLVLAAPLLSSVYVVLGAVQVVIFSILYVTGAVLRACAGGPQHIRRPHAMTRAVCGGGPPPWLRPVSSCWSSSGPQTSRRGRWFCRRREAKPGGLPACGPCGFACIWPSSLT